MTLPDLVPVDSSSLKAVHHDAETNTLTVQFANGGIYAYDGVSASSHAGLMGADSIGAHFAKNIRNKFSFRRLDAADTKTGQPSSND